MKKYDITLRTFDVQQYVEFALGRGDEVVRIREAPNALPSTGLLPPDKKRLPQPTLERQFVPGVDDEVRAYRERALGYKTKIKRNRGSGQDLPALIVETLKGTEKGNMTRGRMLKVIQAKGFAYSSLSSALSQLARDGKVTQSGKRGEQVIHLRFFRPKAGPSEAVQPTHTIERADLGRDNLTEIEPSVRPESFDEK